MSSAVMDVFDFTTITVDGAKLQRLREERNLTQRQVARAVGVTSATVSNYERGHGKPSGDVLARLMLLYRIAPGETISDALDLRPVELG